MAPVVEQVEARSITPDCLPVSLGRVRGAAHERIILVEGGDAGTALSTVRTCRRSGVAFASVPGSFIQGLDSASVKGLVNGAHYLFTSEEERSELLRLTAWPAPTVTRRVRLWITTRQDGSLLIDQLGRGPRRVSPIPASYVEKSRVRELFLAASALGLSGTAAGQLAFTTAALQEQRSPSAVSFADCTRFLADHYGAGVAAEIRHCFAEPN
jgi:adenosine kinase